MGCLWAGHGVSVACNRVFAISRWGGRVRLMGCPWDVTESSVGCRGVSVRCPSGSYELSVGSPRGVHGVCMGRQ